MTCPLSLHGGPEVLLCFHRESKIKKVDDREDMILLPEAASAVKAQPGYMFWVCEQCISLFLGCACPVLTGLSAASANERDAKISPSPSRHSPNGSAVLIAEPLGCPCRPFF